MKLLPADLRGRFRTPLLMGSLLLAALPSVALATGQVGEQAPAFTLVDSAGETIEIVFGQGEVYLLNFIGFS